MKRFVCCVLVMLFALVPSSYAAKPEPTDLRGAVEFTELYMKRLAYMSEYMEEASPDNINTSMSGLVSSLESDNQLILTTGIGTLFVQKETLLVEGGLFTLYTMKEESDNGLFREQLIHSAAGFSALEYDEFGDKRIQLQFKLGSSDSPNSIGKSFNLVMDFFDKYANDSKVFLDLVSGEEVFVYSGNYDWYLTFTESQAAGTNTYGYLNLVAKSRD